MLQEPGAVQVVAVKLDMPESCLDVICGSDCDFLNGLKSVARSDITLGYQMIYDYMPNVNNNEFVRPTQQSNNFDANRYHSIWVTIGMQFALYLCDTVGRIETMNVQCASNFLRAIIIPFTRASQGPRTYSLEKRKRKHVRYDHVQWRFCAILHFLPGRHKHQLYFRWKYCNSSIASCFLFPALFIYVLRVAAHRNYLLLLMLCYLSFAHFACRCLDIGAYLLQNKEAYRLLHRKYVYICISTTIHLF